MPLSSVCLLAQKALCAGLTPEQAPGAEHLDVVSHMCHTFRLGSPLCHLYNLLIPSFVNPQSPLFANLPAPKPIEYEFPRFQDSPEGVKNWAKRPENAKMCQKYIAVFCMAMQQRLSEGRWHTEVWALHELWGKSTGPEAEGYDSTGLMKVLTTVEAMLDCLPQSAIGPMSPSTPYTSSTLHMSRQSYDIPFSLGGKASGAGAVTSMMATMNGGVQIDADSPVSNEAARNAGRTAADANAFKSVEELVSSEKSYVQELEILVRCSQEMLDAHLISTETNHKMFSNLSKILDFHRKFLIKLETEYEPISEGLGPKAWAEGRWGRPFVTSEAEFDCYGPYCANYLDAIAVVNQQMPNLLRGQELPEFQRPCLDPQRELQAFMIKPIQRITKYGLLLDAVLHATAKHDYAYRAELEEGSLAVKRIAANINEVTDFKAKQATVRELADRVEDWKGHDLEKFGDLWLDDGFTVIKADQPREYHVFLFDRMMLCCKEIIPERTKKGGKNSSMLRKDKTASKQGPPEKRNKLSLKGRIFVSNINGATLQQDADGVPQLVISWTVPSRQPNGTSIEVADSFVMTGRSEEVMRKWSDKVLDLAAVAKKAQEETAAARMSGRERYSNDRYGQSQFAPPTPATEAPPFVFPPSMPEEMDGFTSGRNTPAFSESSAGHHPFSSGRRVQSQQAAPPMDRAELRARAMTEDQSGPSITQWRSQNQQNTPPPLPRLTSAMSAMSMSSEASFGTMPRSARNMSASRLPSAEELEEPDYLVSNEMRYTDSRYAPARGMARAPSYGHPPSMPHPPPLRSRSASSPNVYQVPARMSPAMPPIPQTTPYMESPLAASSSSTLVGTGGTAYFNKRMSGKRSSGDSHSTEMSNDSTSPTTPYDVSRQNSQDSNVLVRVRCGKEYFIISVNESIDIASFAAKVHKKLRMSINVPFIDDSVPIKWIDADGDKLAIKSEADIQAMFDESRLLGTQCVNVVAGDDPDDL